MLGFAAYNLSKYLTELVILEWTKLYRPMDTEMSGNILIALLPASDFVGNCT